MGIYPKFNAYHVGQKAPYCVHSDGTQPAKMCNVCKRDIEVIAFHIADAIWTETGELISPTVARAIVKINKIEEVPVV